VAIRGFVANPVFSRGDVKGLYTFVNGRFVKDRTLTHAIIESHRTLLEVGRHPVVVLMLHVPTESVDVNVHPQKLEVRFQDASAIHRAVTQILVPVLRQTPWLQTDSRTYVLPPQAPVPIVSDISEVHRQRTRDALERYASLSPPQESQRPLFTHTASQPNAYTTGPHTHPGLGGAVDFTQLKPLGQVGLTYLLCEGPEGLVVIDQHAAHERVTFEQLKRAAADGRTQSQRLLVPLRVTLTRAEEEALEKTSTALEGAGFDLQPLGPGDALLRATPVLLAGKEPARICKELLAELAESGADSPLQDALDALLARVACHASVRAGDTMTVLEIRALLETLNNVDLGAHCPHGRPVVRALPLSAMARWFDR
jgi:DNA mismatch repair protein MutL